jgi:hypothetical protein
VDRERNDCLGRRGRQRQFEHWRQILRRCRGSDTHANTFSDSDRDRYADGNGNANGDTNSHSNGNCNSNTHGYSELHAEVSTHAAAAPDACAASVVRRTSNTLLADPVLTQRYR